MCFSKLYNTMKSVVIVYFNTNNISIICSLEFVREYTQAVRRLTNEKRNVIDVHAPNEEGGNRW